MKVKCPYCGLEKEVLRENMAGEPPKVTQCDNLHCNKFFGVKVKAIYTPIVYRIDKVEQ